MASVQEWLQLMVVEYWHLVVLKEELSYQFLTNITDNQSVLKKLFIKKVEVFSKKPLLSLF